MGAMAYLSTYFEDAFTQSDINRITEETKNSTVEVLVNKQAQRQTKTQSQTIDGNVRSYTISSLTRIGEFATTDSTGSGGITSDNCKIGNTIAPQVCDQGSHAPERPCRQ
jgi:hypothetical protein